MRQKSPKRFFMSKRRIESRSAKKRDQIRSSFRFHADKIRVFHNRYEKSGKIPSVCKSVRAARHSMQTSFSETNVFPHTRHSPSSIAGIEKNFLRQPEQRGSAAALFPQTAHSVPPKRNENSPAVVRCAALCSLNTVLCIDTLMLLFRVLTAKKAAPQQKSERFVKLSLKRYFA